jgi:hypothetical protein
MRDSRTRNRVRRGVENEDQGLGLVVADGVGVAAPAGAAWP